MFKSDPEVFVGASCDDAAGAALTGKDAGRFVAGTVTGMGKYAASKAKVATVVTNVAGEFVTGYETRNSKSTTVKATGSSTLVPQEGGNCLVFVYLAPKGLPAHARCVEVLALP